MKAQLNVSRYATALLAAALMLTPFASASAQRASTDGRWAAWTGCWAPVGAPDDASTPLLCVVPSTGVSAVDLVTVTKGAEVAREHIDASGQMINNPRDGCTGWDRAQWSQDDQRVYLRANYTCPGGRRQVSSSLLGMTADGELLDVQGLDAGNNKGVRVTQYRPVSDSAAVPADIAAAVRVPSMVLNAARVGASAPLRTADVIDASAHADAPVVEAWLANHGDQISVGAQDLVAMANAGVPGEVTDVLVALSHPDYFAVNPALMGAAPNAGQASGAYADQVTTGRLQGVAGGSAANPRTVPMCPYSAYGWDYSTDCYYSGYFGASAFNPYWMALGYGNMYGPGYGYSNYPYGSGYGYGYGYGGGYGGGWYGGSPVIVVRPSGGDATTSHGRVVKGRGYVPGASPSGGSSGQQAPPARASGSSGGSSSSGSSGGTISGGRTAHRTGGGGH